MPELDQFSDAVDNSRPAHFCAPEAPAREQYRQPGAKDQSIALSGRGRIPAGVIKQYEAAPTER
jgi:hypothetical protein